MLYVKKNPKREICAVRLRRKISVNPIQSIALKLSIYPATYPEIQVKLKMLFDLSSDPLELENLNDKLPDKASELTSQLEEWKQKYTKRGNVQADISEEDRERLKALGYIN